MGGSLMNEKFFDNWLRILNFNKSYNITLKGFVDHGQVRIPFTPIMLELRLLYRLSKELYPRFINDQQHVVDLIISDDEQRVLKILFYRTDIVGIHYPFKEIDPDIIKIQKFPVEDLAIFFDELQRAIYEEIGVRISHVRIFKNKGLTILNHLIENIEILSMETFLAQFLDLFQTLFKQKLLLIYPKPNIVSFLEQIITFFGDFKLSNIFSYFLDLLPDIDLSVIVYLTEFPYVIRLRKKSKKYDASNIELEVLMLKELDIPFEDLTEKEIIKKVHEKLKPRNTFLFHQEHILRLLEDIFEFEIPLRTEKIKLLLQKVLYGYRSFETKWFRKPKPLLYNTILRFLIQNMGIPLNLKKFSHWAGSHFIFNTLRLNFGLNSRVLLIFTNIKNKHNHTLQNGNTLIEKSLQKAIILEIEKENIKGLYPIEREELFDDSGNNSLKDIQLRLNKNHRYIDAVISIDKYLLASFLRKIVFKLKRIHLFSKLKFMRTFRNQKYFDIYPKIPIYRFLKNIQYFYLIKTLLSLFIDKYEF